jgi:hypothetical protein
MPPRAAWRKPCASRAAADEPLGRAGPMAAVGAYLLLGEPPAMAAALRS